ncbi:MAG: Ig-like domain-containing protein, partial [Lysobacterales bacterium]
MKPTKLLAFLLCATVPLACTTTEPVKPETASASYPLTIYPGEEGVFAPSGKSRGKSALAPGRHVARGPFPVNLRDVPPGLTRDKAPPGMEVSKEKRIESPVSEEERERMLEDSKRLPPNARAARGLMSGPSNDGPSTLGPTVGTGWASIDYIGSVPPDPEIAVGPNHVIVTVNSAFQIYDKSGNTVVAETDFDNFFSGVCTGTFDPNALYDEDQDRYIIAMDGNGTEYCVAVSQTNDPTQGWYRYSVPTGSDFFDYPHAGVGRDAIYMGANIFGNSYLRAEIYAIDKFAMYAGTSAPYVMQNIGGAYFTPQPMNLHGAAQGTWPSFGPHYIISGQYNGTTFHVWSWDDPFGANNLVRLGSFDLNSATGVSGGNAVDQPQLGSSALIQGNDWRPLDTEYRDGYLWMSHTIACNPGSGTVNCVRWAQIDPTTQTVLDAGVVASNDEYRSFPDLAVDACGNMAVGYTKTSSSMYPGVYVAGREAADPPGTLQAESLVKAGEISYTAFDGSAHRWGDYTVMTIDPDGSTFWYVGEYSKNTGTTNGRWATWVNASTFGCVPPNAPPAVSVDPATIATMIIGGDEDEFIDNCEVTMVDFEVRNSGAGELTNVEIVSVTPVSHPNSVISTPMPVMLAATLAENASVAASFEFSATDAAPGDTLTFDVEIYADQLTENKVVSMSFDDAEYDIQPVASRTWNFASDIEDWTVQQGTFNHNSGTGAGGSSGYVASSANLNDQCDQIRSPVVYLESNSTLSLSTNYDIEPIYNGRFWYDQANVALLDGGSRGIVDPDSGRLYNADGFGASCVTAGGNGWASSATSWATSGWSANALGAAALAGKPVQIDVAYGTDFEAVGSGFRFDQVTLTNFSQQGPDAQSNVCDGNTAPSVTIASPADGASFQEGDAIGFSASASDTEDGDLSASIAWSSDKDGSIGSGASLNLSTLSANAHVITAAVTDSGSLSGSDSISITVNAPPAVSIDSFAASPNPIVVGESSTLSWSVSNASDCQAGGDWSGTKNAGGGSEGVSPATEGDYTYTLSCTGDGAPDSASVTLTV